MMRPVIQLKSPRISLGFGALYQRLNGLELEASYNLEAIGMSTVIA